MGGRLGSGGWWLGAGAEGPGGRGENLGVDLWLFPLRNRLGELTSVLQERCRRLSPRQYLPPMVGLEREGEQEGWAGEAGGPSVSSQGVPRADLGLSQCRLEEDTPPPQVRLQSPHGVHGPQAPSTPSGRDPKGTHTRL